MHTTPLALGEIGPGAFLAITVGYFIGGVLCIVLAATGFGGTTGRSRVLSGVIGAACLIYAVYLLTGDAESVFISYYIMALPVILLIRAIVVFVQRRKGTGPVQPGPVNAGTSWPPAQVPQQPNPGWPAQPNQPYAGQPFPGQQQPQPGQPFPGQQPQPAQQFPGQQQVAQQQGQPGQPWPAQPQQPRQPQRQAWPAQQADPTAPAPAATTFPPQQQPPYPPQPR
jgi:hypothetical protein